MSKAKLNSRIATGHDSVYFGQRILWPVSRSLDDKDVLILKAYQIRKGLPDSLLGSVTINLYPLTRDVHSTFRENLVNSSHHPTGILLLFELRYQSPDSSHGDLDDDLVNYPLADTDYSLDDAENEINQDQPPPISSFVDLGDDLNQIIDHHLAEDEEWEVGSQLSAPERKDPRIAAMLGPTIYRSNQFQVYNMRSHPLARLLPGKLVGEFVTDVQTIYNEKDHSILNKWAVLIDPKDPWKGPTGYVKVDMHVIEEGQQVKSLVTTTLFCIYQAEDLPPMNTEISNRIRKAFVGENTPNLDSYVEVSYAGHTAKTKTERYTYNPIWNETIEFCDYFPSFTRTIRINVRNGGIKGELIATRLIDIRDIMCHITGPIRSMEDEDVIRIGTTKYVANPISETAAGKKSLYFLFACFSEASVIEKKLGAKNKPISFEMSFGIYGNKLDGKRGGVEPQMLELAQPNETREQVDWCYSTTPPMLPSTEDKEYYYLNFGRKKPCLYLTGYYEDHRSRMCIPNIYYQIQRVKHLFIRRRITDAKNYLRTVFLTMAKKFNLAQESIRSCRDTASTTLLDREYSRRIRRDLRRMALLMINLSKQVHKHTLGEKIKDANGLHKRLCNLTNCPQDGLPDVFISMIMDNQRVGFVRIPARDIYYSVVDCERGKWSGQMATLYLRKQGREGVGSKGWRIQSQIRVYLWLGLIKDFVTYTNGLPSGYDKNIFKTPKPPNELIYLESSRFQLRCYIFIARDLIASDSSGMSDPMARILIGSHVLQTQVLYQTMSPMWDVLLYKQVTFYQSAQSVKQNLQEVIVEIFDIDPGNDLEFMGRCFCEVNVTLDGEKYKPPRLQWWPVFRGQTPGGELLAAFDLIQLFWSVWGMVRQHLLPVKRPRVVVEIGGHKLESEIIKDLSKLPIFDIPLKAMDVYLPVDERYWPPLVFTCFDNRILGTKITIGTQASDNSSTVYMDSESDGPGKLNFGFGKGEYLCNQEPNSEMSTTRKTSERGFESTKSIDTSGSIVQLLADMNPSFQQYNLKYKLPDDAGDLDLVSIDGNDIAGTGGEKRSPDALPGQAHLVTTHSGPTPEQLATADWWTRFYVTIRSGETNFDDSRYKNEVNPLTESEDSDIEEKLEKIDVKPDKDSEEEIDETNGTKPNYLNYKQKKKCWQRTKQAEKKKLTALEKRQLEIARRRARIEKRKKNKKNLKAKIKARFIDSKGLFLKEFVDLNYDVETQEDQSWVETILVYPVALEEVPDFNGFNTPFQNLPFYKGKQLEDNTSESRITGFFKAIKLHPSDPNGKSDPYLIVSLGKSIINDRDDYKPKTLNPVFGKYYEFVAHLPMDSLLSIQLMDHERVGADTLIGETHIDIENRFHSAHRATYSQQPTEILSKLCEKYGIEQPVYNILENKITIGSETFFANTEIRSETGITIKSVEPLALEALHNWPLIIKKDVKLVSEHVETRSLKHPDNPGLIQGRLQMWIDMFEREVAVPPPAINISPRVPAGYELRVIVSLSGEGNFNWRFIFPFDYIKAEDRIIYPIKGTFDIEPHMIKANCELTLQVWDADIIASDNFIGSISMRLSSLPRCAKTAKSCGLHQLEPDCPKFSMFKNRTARGWWPVTDEVEEEIVVQGKVECQLEMLNSAEAESNPAGLGRDEPNGLPKPNRPDSSFMKFLGPLNTLRYLIKYRLKWILIKIFIIFLVCLIIFLFLYSFPGAIVQKMVNG
ncbi:Otoferlin [Schistosoma japonicum]|nr:Otoferlin [Schistosoma japonicum]